MNLRELSNGILEIFQGRDRLKAVALLVMIVGASLWETAGVASIGPFLAVISSPDAVQKSGATAYLYRLSGAPDIKTFEIYLGVATVFTVLFANVLASLTLWVASRFVFGQGYRLGRRLLGVYLAQPYAYFLQHNSIDLARNVYDEVPRAISGVVLPLFYVIARGMTVVLIVALLVYMDKFVAFIVMGFFGVSYFLLFKILQQRNRNVHTTIAERRASALRLASEALSGVKEIKVLGSEQSSIEMYSVPAAAVARADARHQVMATLPKYILESIGFVGIVLIVLLLLMRGEAQLTAVPLVAVYAFAGYRLMPALQHLYTNIHFIQYYSQSLKMIVAALQTARPASRPAGDAQRVSPLVLERAIEIENLSFRYPSAPSDVLDNISLRIKAKSVVGIVGSTGSGKSTLLDIVLGLLEPSAGRLAIDGVTLDEKLVHRWQAGLGYVPQQIFLTDGTIAENIALGVAPSEIDFARIQAVAKAAHVDEFVEQLPDGYNSGVGERGVRLSGGQRQRIGIARALYRNPGVLLFDEATSALDNLTEHAIMDTLQNLTGQKTIILVAHRLTTLRLCDQIILLENGRISCQGTYDELLQNSDYFRESHNAGRSEADAVAAES
jgi:ABC-type multidrug transport system fused ATPase/permease subunit